MLGEDSSMNRRLRNVLAALGSAFPSAFSPYWRALPLRRLTKFLLGTFFTASVIGFAVDLLQLDYQRLGRGFYWPILVGVTLASFMLAAIKRIRLVLLLYAVFGGVVWFGYSVVRGSTHSPIPDELRQHAAFDAIGIMVCLGLGFRLLLSFATTEGLAGVRSLRQIYPQRRNGRRLD